MTLLRFAITSPHQDVKRTCTSKLSIMYGVPQKRGRLTPSPFKIWSSADKMPVFNKKR